MANFVELFNEKFAVQGIPTSIILDGNGQLVSARHHKKYLSTPGEAGQPWPGREFCGILQKSLAALLCGTIFLVAHGVAIGCVWAWKETQPMTTITNTIAIGNVTATTVDAAWSQWYRSHSIIVLVFEILAGLMTLTQVVVNCNQHVAKANYHTAAGRLEEAADGEAEEGECVKMCICCTSFLDKFAVFMQCIPSIWCCVGLICFGSSSGLSMVAVQSGWNDNSKYYVLIQIAAVLSGCVALCCFGLNSKMGFGAALFTSGLTDDLEAEK